MTFPQRRTAVYAIRECAIEYSSGVSVLFLWEFRNTLPNSNIAYVGVRPPLEHIDFLVVAPVPPINWNLAGRESPHELVISPPRLVARFAAYAAHPHLKTKLTELVHREIAVLIQVGVGETP